MHHWRAGRLQCTPEISCVQYAPKVALEKKHDCSLIARTNSSLSSDTYARKMLGTSSSQREHGTETLTGQCCASSRVTFTARLKLAFPPLPLRWSVSVTVSPTGSGTQRLTSCGQRTCKRRVYVHGYHCVLTEPHDSTHLDDGARQRRAVQARASPSLAEALRVVSVAVGEEVTQCIVRGALPQINRDLASVPTVDQHPSRHNGVGCLECLPSRPLTHRQQQVESSSTAMRICDRRQSEGRVSGPRVVNMAELVSTASAHVKQRTGPKLVSMYTVCTR